MVAEASSLSSGILRIGNAEWTPVTLRRALQSSLPSVEVQTVTLGGSADENAKEQDDKASSTVEKPAWRCGVGPARRTAWPEGGREDRGPRGNPLRGLRA